MMKQDEKETAQEVSIREQLIGEVYADKIFTGVLAVDKEQLIGSKELSNLCAAKL